MENVVQNALSDHTAQAGEVEDIVQGLSIEVRDAVLDASKQNGYPAFSSYSSTYKYPLIELVPMVIKGIRPLYFVLSLAPLVTASVQAWTGGVSAIHPAGSFHWSSFLLLLVTGILIQSGVIILGDYQDILRHSDGQHVLQSGKLLQQALVLPSRMMIVGLASLAAAGITGLFLVKGGSGFIYVYILAAITLAYLYSGTKYALTAIRLGDIATFLLYGTLPAIIGYMSQTGTWTSSIFLAGIPFGLLAVVAMHFNDMRDQEMDTHGGKYTLAQIFSLNGNRIFQLSILLIVVVLFLRMTFLSAAFILLIWTLPALLVVITSIFRRASSQGFRIAATETIRLEYSCMLWLSIAYIIAAYVPFLPSVKSLFPSG